MSFATLNRKEVTLKLVSNTDFSKQVSSKKKWISASTAEVTLGKQIAARIQTSNRKEQASKLYKIALELLEKKDKTVLLGAASSINDSVVSSNLISQIAYELEQKYSDVKQSGSYFTPYVLAEDMVRIAKKKWGEAHKQKNDEMVRWYDPCVGGGVFPVAIAQYLLSKGETPNDIISQISGSDLNLLFVEATKIRLALFLSKGKLQRFQSFYKQLGKQFTQSDSLLTYTEEKDMFSQPKELVDIVVGNPPYIRSNNISPELKEIYGRLYPSVASGTTDLYMLFIAHGINALSKGGVLCYVSPATFQRTASGKPIRAYISKYASVDAIYDFDELNVFEDVGSHISVYLLSKGEQIPKTSYTLFSRLPSMSPLSENSEPVVQTKLSSSIGDAWSFNADNSSVLPLIEKGTVRLYDYVNGIYSGIKSGLKNAYELNAREHAAILNDERSKEYIFPLLKPRQIEKWSLNWNDTFQIVIQKGQTIDTQSQVYKHLLTFKDALTKRTDLRNKEEWYSLRDCAYFELFTSTKIVYRDISSTNRFAMDTKGMLVVDGGFFIPKEDYFLLGLLNSKVGAFYFRSKCATIGSVGSRGRLRFKKVYVAEFPVPANVPRNIRSDISSLAKQISTGGIQRKPELEEQLNELVLNLYDVPQKYKSKILNV